MMEGDERKDGGGEVQREEREEREEQGNGAAPERKRRERDGHQERPRSDERRKKERGDGEVEWRREPDRREHRRGHHRGGSRNREPSARGNRDPNTSYDSLASTDRKKKRIEDKEKQACTIFVGDLDPSSTAEQLTGLFKRFGSVLSAKIKDDHCYGFVTFDKREAAEAAIAAGQKQDGIELLNNKQVYVSWALGSLPEWKKGIGGFTLSPGKDQLRHRSRKGVVKPSVLAAATAAAAAKAHSVLAGEMVPAMEPLSDYRGRAIVAYDDLL